MATPFIAVCFASNLGHAIPCSALNLASCSCISESVSLSLYFNVFESQHIISNLNRQEKQAYSMIEYSIVFIPPKHVIVCLRTSLYVSSIKLSIVITSISLMLGIKTIFKTEMQSLSEA